MLSWLRNFLSTNPAGNTPAQQDIAPPIEPTLIRTSISPKIETDWVKDSPWKGNEPAEHALHLMERTRRSFFLSGAAGTGKSALLRYWREHTAKRVQVVAPTGVAALNVEGLTMHSFFRLPLGVIKLADIHEVPDRRRWRTLDAVVIDEIGMVRADLLDGVEQFLRLNGPHPGEPFGGVQIIMVGDPLQLPPVVEEDTNEYFNRSTLDGEGYPAPEFFAAHAWEGLRPEVVVVRRTYRQQDGGFLAALNRARHGAITNEDLSLFNTRVQPVVEDEPRIALVGTNADADFINQRRLSRLEGNEGLYRGVVTGRFEQTRLPVPLDLRLRPKAWVMMTKNDSGRRWVNGTAGIVKELGTHSVWVEVFAHDAPPATYEIGPAVWGRDEYRWDRLGKMLHREAGVGSYEQLPINLAWAITIHKSQGKTLRKMRLDPGGGLWEPGHAYTALSRLKSLEGLALTRPLARGDFKASETVRAFLSQHGETA